MDIFSHVPKTGGTTLATTLRWVYGPRNAYKLSKSWRGNPERFRKEHDRQKLDNAKVVDGHVRFGFHRHFEERGRHRYFTMLRHPMRRYLSRYFHLKMKYPNSHQHITLESYCRGDHSWSGRDELVHYIAGIDPAETPGAALERAKEHLVDTYAGFGILEHFDASLLLLRRRLGWSRTPFYLVSNRRPSRPRLEDLSEESVSLVHEQNQLDLALYRFAQRRFAKALKQEFEDLPARLRSFQTANAFVQPFASSLLSLYRTGRTALHSLRGAAA